MQEISPDYYRDHFWQVINGVEKRYGLLLTENELEYVKILRSLTVDALSLYIRIANRKGPFFRVNKFKYEDITNIKSAILELQKYNLVLNYQSGNHIDQKIFDCFNHKEIYQFLKGHSFKRFAKKSELQTWLDSWDEYHNWLNAVLYYEPIIHLSATDLWPFFKFLFFGELTDNLSGFVIRELGHMVNVDLSDVELTPIFVTRCDAENSYRLANIYAEFRVLREITPAIEIYEWWQNQGILRDNLSGMALNIFDRLVARLGRRLEREGHNEIATELYTTSPVAPSRERLARIYIKSGEIEKAVQLLVEMQASLHSEEAYVARQLLARVQKTKKRSDARDLLNNAAILKLDHETGRAEKAVLDYYSAQGWQGIHGENWLWNNLFGLFFWDIIYDTSYGSFNQPLQFAPADMHKPEFYLKRQEKFAKQAKLLEHSDDAIKHLNEIYAANFNISNPFVNWHEGLLSLLGIVINSISPKSLQKILLHMAKNLKLYRRGFPDLFIWKNGDYRFIEVKTSSDQISPQQFHWLAFFKDNGVDCTVEKVLKTDDIKIAA